MSDAVLEKMIAGYMATPQPAYSFGWQGGEPTLMGLEFFRKVTALQKRYGEPGASVANGLQTNATLIDDEFAAHLAEYNFLVGVSLDGPVEVHDAHRRTAGGNGTYEKVRRGIDALRRHNVQFNILVLVNSANVEHPREIYSFLKGEGFNFHQYIPCVEFDESGDLLPFAVTGEQWGVFLSEIFDEWYAKDTRRVSIRHFDSMLEFMVNGRYNVCAMGGVCDNYFVVEHNGDVYPCDFFVDEDKRLGNVLSDSWEAMGASGRFRSFAGRKTRWNEECVGCEYLSYCSGDCPKNRYRLSEDPRQKSVLCDGWKAFYHHSLERMKGLAVEVMNEQPARGPGRVYEVREPAPAPEEPCFCGSGKMYKNCHGQKKPVAKEAGRSQE